MCGRPTSGWPGSKALPILSSMQLPDGNGAQATADVLAVKPDTKVVMVCNPNNPTGTVLTEAEMEAVVDVAERAGAWIVADEIYRGAKA